MASFESVAQQITQFNVFMFWNLLSVCTVAGLDFCFPEHVRVFVTVAAVAAVVVVAVVLVTKRIKLQIANQTVNANYPGQKFYLSGFFRSSGCLSDGVERSAFDYLRRKMNI